MKYFAVKNFEKFQRFKDRNPTWIKLYTTLLTDHDFENLPEVSQLHLIKIWLLASQLDNKLPLKEQWIRQKIGSQSQINLKLLLKRGWILIITNCNSKEVLSPSLKSYVGQRREENINLEEKRRVEQIPFQNGPVGLKEILGKMK